MAFINQRSGQPVWSSGRGFSSADPERQGEVLGFIRSAFETAPASRTAPERTGRTSRLDWMRVQADRDSTTFEGSSSRRGR